MTAIRHRWGAPVRYEHHTSDRHCVVCGVILRTRKEPPKYWTEYWRDGAKLDARPECVSVGDNYARAA